MFFSPARLQVGGVWNLPDETPVDPQSTDYRSSMYPTLRTNLPKDLMAYLDFPMAKAGCVHERYPSHACIAKYLTRFAENFDLKRRIRFSSNVERVEKQGSKWNVRVTGVAKVEAFDAVVVANGHYFRPRFADIPGRATAQRRVSPRDPGPALSMVPRLRH